jgi:chemotaxis methyl-accepting protein methylase
MRALGIDDFARYYDYLTNNPQEFTKLLDTLTIKLSYFFRNSETFDYLKSDIMPRFEKNDQVVIWSAGCAQGEEPYSLAIIATESGLSKKVIIYATDIDDHALEKARAGIYPTVVFQYTPQSYIDKYFVKHKDGYQIGESLKSSIKFVHLDLFDRFPYGLCDLIMCRNVLIYMDRAAQSTVVRRFYDTLKPGGYLVIGKVELLLGIPEAKIFEIVNRSERVYRKIGN